jgi:hypothetical protein
MANSSSTIVYMTPAPLVMELSWDRKNPANSDFIFGKRKKSPGVISGEQGGWGIILTPFATGDSWIEVVVWTW